MNIKAIIASLVLGSSSLAVAAPGAPCNDAPIARPMPPVYQQPSHAGWSDDYGGGWQRPTVMPVAYQAPVALARGLTFQGAGRRFLSVGAQAGRFSTLQISAEGRTFIKQVYVQFENGQEQVIRDLDRTLFRGEELTLDLDGNRRAIKRIVVYGSDLNRGWRRTAGGFTVTAA